MEISLEKQVSDTQLNQYRKQGYLVIKNFFDPLEIDEVLSEAKSIFCKQMKYAGIDVPDSLTTSEFSKYMEVFFQKDLERFRSVGRATQHLTSMHKLSRDQRILDTLKKLGLQWPLCCNKPSLLFNCKNLAKEECYYRFPPHQDYRSIQGSINSSVAWIPLRDVDASLGALQIVPKSHFNGLVEIKETYLDKFPGVECIGEDVVKEDEWVNCEMNVGDILFFSTFSFHRSGMNVTDDIRWSMTFRYNDLEDEFFIDNGYPHPYKTVHEHAVENDGEFPQRIKDVFTKP